MPDINLPDGSIRSYEKTITVADVALDIGEGLARAALAGKINNCLVDLNYEINNDSDLEIITSKNNLFNSSASFFFTLKSQETIPPKALIGSQASADL